MQDIFTGEAILEAFDNSGDGLAVWDASDNLIDFNLTYNEMFKRNMHMSATKGLNFKHAYETSLKSADSIVKNTDFSKRVQLRDKARRDQIPIIGEFSLDDKIYKVREVASKNGQLVTYISDITQIRLQETELERLQNGLEQVNSGISFWSKNNKLIFVNKFLRDFTMETTGYEMKPGVDRLHFLEHVVTKGLIDYGDKPAREVHDDLMNLIDTSEAGASIEFTTTTVEGAKKFWLNTAFRLQSGEWMQIITDISAQKNRETHLMRLSNAIDVMNTGVILWDKNHQLVFANKQMYALQNSWDFKFEPGVSRYDMLKNQEKRNAAPFPKGQSVEGWIAYTTSLLQENPEGIANEIAIENSMTLTEAKLLSDGSYVQSYTDITEIRSQQKDLKTLFDGIEKLANPILIWGPTNNLFFFNAAAKKMNKEHWGINLKKNMPRKALLEKLHKQGLLSLSEGMSIDDYMEFQKGRMTECDDGITNEIELGQEVTLLAHSRMLDDGSFIQNFTNISEIKANEKVINVQRKRFSRVLGDLGAIVFESDLEKNIITYEVPDSLKKFWGNNNTISTIEGGYSMLKSTFVEPYKAAIREHILGFSDEIRVEHINEHDGKEVWYQTRAKAIFKNKKATKLFGIVENIDKQKSLEIQVQTAEKQVYDAINTIEAGIMLWDADDRLLLVNSFFEEHYNTTLELGLPYKSAIRKFINAGIFAVADDELEAFVQARVKQRGELKGIAVGSLPTLTDGTHIQMTSKRLENGGIVQIFSDVTDIKKREVELEELVIELNRAKDLADTANQTKSQFLANMSHELRTPLNAIIGLTEMLKEDCVDDGLDDFIEPLDRVFSAGKHLLTLINDVLDLSKIEAGKVEIYNETFDLKSIINEIARTTQPLLDINNNKMIINYEDDIDEITNDQTRFKQILLNLISNATKFTENGKVLLNIRKEGHTGGGMLSIDVVDTGIGMTEEQMGRLFTAFVQADSSTTRKYGGTGLGLTISKQLAGLMGGDVMVKSTVNVGTTFTATVSINNIAEGANLEKRPARSLITRVVTTEQMNSKTVLIIDDDPTVSELMERQLAKNGYNVIKASNGKDGLRLAKEKSPDVIMLDILMPEIDGWSTLRSLKAHPDVQNIPVIMASILDEKNKGFSLGAADFLSKPIEKDYLLNAIRKLIGTKENSTILLVEDDDDLRFVVREILEKTDINVIEADNGAEALEALGRAEAPPDLILLDLMMPIMNGFEFLQNIHKTDHNSIPVLVLTGADLSEAEREFLSSETLRVIEKGEDTVDTIAQEIDTVISQLSGAKTI